MSGPCTPYQIVGLWAAAFASDRLLRHFAESNYGRPFAVQIGADMQRPPSEDDAPFLALFPDSGQSGPQRASVSSKIGIVAGINDGEWLDAGGVRALRGLYRLGELMPLLEAAMRQALPGARLQTVDVEFEIMQYPLCMALVTVTVEEGLPVGRR